MVPLSNYEVQLAYSSHRQRFSDNTLDSLTQGFIIKELTTLTMSNERVEKVADAMTALGYEGIVQFDIAEPSTIIWSRPSMNTKAKPISRS